MNGILILDKPSGITSHRAVSICRTLFSEKKIGHTGTLDPLATGVLPLLLGNATRAAEFLSEKEKSYTATFRVGTCTDTQDVTGKTLETTAQRPSFEELNGAAQSFLGVSAQVPPMYSALKQGGVPLYKLARQGKSVSREAREICVSSLVLSPTEEADVFSLRVTVSKGTYIRTLICDLAEKAGTLAVMETLRREMSAGYTTKDAVSIPALEQAHESGEDMARFLLPTESIFEAYPCVRLSAFYERLARNGAEIYPARAGVGEALGLGERVRLCGEDGAWFAVGELREFEEGAAIKPIRLFL